MLTTREQAIAAIAATGATNRQIGRTLFLSHKTVESHLGSIFRKLGVASRTELSHLLTAPIEIRPAAPARTR